MAVQKTNFVHAVANTAGISLETPKGTLTKPGSISEYASKSAGNMAAISEMAKEMTNIQQDSPSPESPISGGPSVPHSLVETGVAFALGAIAPPLGALAGVGMVIREVANFVGHAATHGAQGELTMANAAATFDQSGEMTSYKPACEDVTYNVATGQPQRQAPLSPLGAAVGEVASGYDNEQIRGDIKSMMDKETEKYGWAQNKLKTLGFEPSSMVADASLDMTPDKPRPRAFHAPSFG